METEKTVAITQAREVRLRATGFNMDALSDDLKARLALLDDDELAVLAAVKKKLNEGLSQSLRQAADTVGGFVW